MDRKIVDWPTEEGLWWMERSYGKFGAQVVLAYAREGELLLHMVGIVTPIDRNMRLTLGVQKPPRFIRCEPNPFEKGE